MHLYLLLCLVTNVSAAEVEPEVQVQSEKSNIGVAPCADEIVTKFRMLNGKSYSIVVGTRPEDTGWISKLIELTKEFAGAAAPAFFINDSFANYNSSGSSHACACCSYSEARERRSPAEHGSQSSFSASVR